MLKLCFLFFITIACFQTVCAQKAIKRQQFFLEDSALNIQLTTDIRALRHNKQKPKWQPAHIVVNFSDSFVIDENIRIELRGSYRKDNCDIASLMLDCKTQTSPLLSDLKKIKLVGGCRQAITYEELLLKEYLVYKIYNILSPMSFRVRLLHITYNDAQKKIKSYTQYAFLIEDIKDVADRNNCKEVKNKTYGTEATNRQQINFLSIFQYMIGNTDWAVPNVHNIKLIVPLADTLSRPYPVPYDFDYCGLVDAPYAIPDENLEIKTVRERYYRGYERTMGELNSVVSIFKAKHDSIMQCINNFELIKPGTRKSMVNYLEQFYDATKSDANIKYVFISNAIKK